MSTTPQRISGSEIGDDDTPLGQLIESGTGLSIPPANSSDPLTAFEARHVSLRTAELYIQKLETIKEDDQKDAIKRDLLRFAVLLLADLALIAYRGGKRTPVRLSTIARHLNSPRTWRQSKNRTKRTKRRRSLASPSEEFSLLHLSLDKDGRPRNSHTKISGHPSYAKVLSVLSGLTWHFESETNRPQFRLLVNLVKSVYPPLFILRSHRRKKENIRSTEPRTAKRKRQPWRQLSEAVNKYRPKKNREQDYEALCAAMTTALQALTRPS